MEFAATCGSGARLLRIEEGVGGYWVRGRPTERLTTELFGAVKRPVVWTPRDGRAGNPAQGDGEMQRSARGNDRRVDWRTNGELSVN